jgi:hypothetical protein
MNRLEKPKEFLTKLRLTDSDYQDNGMINHLADLLERYSTEQLNLYGVSNRRGLLIDFAEKVYRRIYFTWDKKTSEKVVDEYIKGNL